VQFFFNSTGEFTPETIAALRALHLNRQADLLQQAAQLLFPAEVPRDLEERNEQIITSEDANLDRQLQTLDSRFYATGGGQGVYERLCEWYPVSGNSSA
jgi:hypothetical protein